MERLIHTLTAIASQYGNRLRDERWAIEQIMLRDFNDDSRTGVLIGALELDVPERLLNGAAQGTLAELIVARKLFSTEAATWAVAVWATAVGLAEMNQVPTLLPA